MSQPRLLIVDDDQRVCFLAKRSLEAIALCDAAHDVAQAVRALHHQSYDLVLVDVGLPGPSGMTLLDQLRRRWPQTAAVMLSGATDLSIANESLNRGALGYVVKPFRIRDLRIQVTAALAAAQRSTGAARTSARARIIAGLSHSADEHGDIACVVVDLDHISLLNASYGVDAIDRLCERVEQRLRVFDASIEMLGRLGPTTLTAALGRCSARNLMQTAYALHSALAAPTIIDGQRIPIASRIGIAVASLGETADSTLNLAEAAAVAARDCGQPYIVYDGDDRDTARTQQELLASVAAAIHHGALHVAYQPQFNLATKQCVGFEALARWHHPTRGDIPASVFVPLAEQMDLIDELGAQILHAACTDLAKLRRTHNSSSLRASVNASTTELRDVNYPSRVRTALRDTDLPASALRLEITESLALDESDEVRQVVGEIQQLGVQFSVDDFGTGYSSFSTLTRVPWAEIKLDRTLTTQCADIAGQEMLRAIINFGAALNMDVIAEGIETPDHLNRLQALGCRFGQGFLLGRPQPLLGVTRGLLRAAA